MFYWARPLDTELRGNGTRTALILLIALTVFNPRLQLSAALKPKQKTTFLLQYRWRDYEPSSKLSSVIAFVGGCHDTVQVSGH